MPYLLDADWIIQSLGQRPRAAYVLDELAPEGVFVSWVTVCEVYEGVFRSSNPQAHLDTFRQFLSPFRALGLDEPTVELIPDLDILLGATAVRHGLTLLTFNARHLRRIPDLQIYLRQLYCSRPIFVPFIEPFSG